MLLKSQSLDSTVNSTALNISSSDLFYKGAALQDSYQLGSSKYQFTLSNSSLPTVTINASDANAAEVNSGQTVNPGVFTITRTGSTANTLSIAYSVSGTATKGSDYNNITGNSGSTGTVVIPVGKSSVNLPINVTNDSTPESNETVVLTLSAKSAYTVGTSKTATVKIADNDKPTVTIIASDPNAAEVNSGITANPGVFTVTRNGSTATTLTVNYTVSGTATKSSDYNNITGNTTSTGKIVIPVGKSSVTLPINVSNDNLVESNETVILTLGTNSAYTVGTNKTATVTINDNDKPTVTITANDLNAAEVKTGQTANPGAFTITRTGSTATALNISYTVGGTATKGSDYNNVTGNSGNTGTIVIPVGKTSVTLPINITDDTVQESSETVVITLGTNNAYTIGSGNKATVAIADNDTITDPIVGKFSKTGNNDIDALLSPLGNYWNTSNNGGVITYSFYKNGSDYYGDETVSEVNNTIKSSVREILATISTFINVRFQEVADTTSSYGVIRYMFSNGGGRDFYAYAYLPTNSPLAADIHLNPESDSDPANSYSGGYGSYGYTTLIHETYHALGLKHPGNYNGTSGTSDGPYLLPEQDNNTNTVMTYNGGGANPVTAMPLDIQALQYLYGKASNNSTATTYKFRFADSYSVGDKFFGTDTADIKQTIWDSGGVDIIDMSAISGSSSYVIDMREGGIITTGSAYYSEIYQDRTTGDYYYTPYFGVSIAYDTIIENLITSTSSEDINANSAANTFKGYTSGTYTGNDVYYQTSGADVIELSGYSLSNLTTSVENIDGSAALTVSLGNYGSIQVRDYFISSNSTRFKIGNSYYRYSQTRGWQLAPTAMVIQNNRNIDDMVTGGLTAKHLSESEISTDTTAVIACQCPACRVSTVTKNIGASTLIEAISV